MANKDNQYKYYIPMEMDKETAKAYGLESNRVHRFKVANKYITGILYGTDDDQLYRTYMHSLWNSAQADYRATRCLISNGNGRLVRCRADCSECPHDRSGNTASSYVLKEEGHTDTATVPDMCEARLAHMTYEALYNRLFETNPEQAEIFRLLYEGATQKEIAKYLGVSRQSNVEYKVKKLREVLRQYISREDILA